MLLIDFEALFFSVLVVGLMHDDDLKVNHFFGWPTSFFRYVGFCFSGE